MAASDPDISELWTRMSDYSGAVSAGVRQLSFAGLAVVWAFSGGKARTIADIPPVLGWAMRLFLIALFFDLCQYLCGTYAFRRLARYRELHRITKPTGVAPFVFWPLEGLFLTKTLCVLAGFLLIGWVFL